MQSGNNGEILVFSTFQQLWRDDCPRVFLESFFDRKHRKNSPKKDTAEVMLIYRKAEKEVGDLFFFLRGCRAFGVLGATCLSFFWGGLGSYLVSKKKPFKWRCIRIPFDKNPLDLWNLPFLPINEGYHWWYMISWWSLASWEVFRSALRDVPTTCKQFHDAVREGDVGVPTHGKGYQAIGRGQRDCLDSSAFFWKIPGGSTKCRKSTTTWKPWKSTKSWI